MVHEGFQFLNHEEAATFEAIAARIWPGTPDDPGAREAGTVYYLDRALAGAYADKQTTYRMGLAAINRAAQTRYGQAFHQLTDAQQDALLADMDKNRVEEFQKPLAAEFFNLCIAHTMEGVFSDPIYGGNRDFAGWKVVGYPGPRYTYTAEEQLSTKPLNKPFKSIADL